MQTTENQATVTGGKLRLKKSFVKPITIGGGEVQEIHLSTLAPIKPDTYRQCPTCSIYCI